MSGLAIISCSSGDATYLVQLIIVIVIACVNSVFLIPEVSVEKTWFYKVSSYCLLQLNNNSLLNIVRSEGALFPILQSGGAIAPSALPGSLLQLIDGCFLEQTHLPHCWDLIYDLRFVIMDVQHHCVVYPCLLNGQCSYIAVRSKVCVSTLMVCCKVLWEC